MKKAGARTVGIEQILVPSEVRAECPDFRPVTVALDDLALFSALMFEEFFGSNTYVAASKSAHKEWRRRAVRVLDTLRKSQG